MQDDGRVLIAASHVILRVGIRAVLEDSGFVIVGDSGTCVEAVAAVAASRPQVCLLDAGLSGGFDDAIRAIRRGRPEVAILVLADTADRDLLLRSVRAGARGFLAKDVAIDQLPRAVAAVVRGEAVIPRRLIEALLDELSMGGPTLVSPQREPRLTDREQQILDMVRAGSSTARIADCLFVSPGTVRTHISAIVSKLQLPDRTALIDVRTDAGRTSV